MAGNHDLPITEMLKDIHLGNSGPATPRTSPDEGDTIDRTASPDPSPGHSKTPQAFAQKLRAATLLVRYGRMSPIMIWQGGELEEIEPLRDPDDDYDDDETHDEWVLKLPIYGTIALRRAVKRDEDVIEIKRKQWSQWTHEVFDRAGKLKNVAFVEVDWSPTEEESAKKHERRGEPTSPKTRPTVAQLSQEEWEAEAYE